METVKLKVTSKVIAQVNKSEHEHQEQIAITAPTGSLAPAIATANRHNRINISIASALTLNLGDTGAIWRAHNRGNEEAFDGLFEFLSRYPDKKFEFVCSIDKKE
jgi:predicted protein tyrosine phosphatase